GPGGSGLPRRRHRGRCPWTTCSPRAPRCWPCTWRRLWSATWSSWCWPRAPRNATTRAWRDASPGARARADRSRWSAAPGPMPGCRAATSSPPTTSGRWRRTCCATACCPATRPRRKAGTASAWSRTCWRRSRCPDGDGRVSEQGIRPTLAELVELRAAATGRRVPRRGRLGHGPAPSPLRGRGMEYAESREYTAGDDARHIDWRVTARSGRAHTKVYQAERERLSLVVADTAPALYY